MYFDYTTLQFHQEDGDNRILITESLYNEVQAQLQLPGAELTVDENGLPYVNLPAPPVPTMGYFYCAQDNAFYDSKHHDTCIEVTESRFNEIMSDLDNGYTLEPDVDGLPTTVPPPEAPEPVEPVVPDVPEPTIDEELEFAKDRVAFGRFVHETSPLTLPTGQVLKMDRESQGQLLNTYNCLKNGLIESTPWKGANGWTLITLVEVEPIATIVANHVRAAFAREEVLCDRLDTLYVNEDIAAIRAFEWSLTDD